MLFRVDPSSAVGLADQIAATVRAALVDGSLRAGEKLPPARQVAAGLEVNMHTVLRAYQALRDEGLIELRRGRGATVRVGVDAGLVALRRRLDEVAAEAVRLDWDAERAADEMRAAMQRSAGGGHRDRGSAASSETAVSPETAVSLETAVSPQKAVLTKNAASSKKGDYV